MEWLRRIRTMVWRIRLMLPIITFGGFVHRLIESQTKSVTIILSTERYLSFDRPLQYEYAHGAIFVAEGFSFDAHFFTRWEGGESDYPSVIQHRIYVLKRCEQLRSLGIDVRILHVRHLKPEEITIDHLRGDLAYAIRWHILVPEVSQLPKKYRQQST